MLILVILGILGFTINLVLLLYNFGIQTSLSESYYNLEKKKRKLGVLFYIYLVITIFLLITPMVNAGGFGGFIACVGLGFVGTAPAFYDKLQRKIHVVGALTAAIGSLIELILIHQIIWILPIIAVIVILSLLTKSYRSSLVFGLEMIAFYSLFLGLIIFFI